MFESLLPPKQAATCLLVSEKAVLDWLRLGTLKGVKAGRQWRSRARPGGLSGGARADQHGRGGVGMMTTRHPVDFAYTDQELQALFRLAHAHDVERGGRYDARSAAIIVWSHHWAHPATREESETIGTLYVH